MNSRFINSISNSLSNISAHYDISNEMFEAFLSKDMTYSCAYFTPELGGLQGDLTDSQNSLTVSQGAKTCSAGRSDSNASDIQTNGLHPRHSIPPAPHKLDALEDPLEKAQYEKLDLIIRNAKIGPTDQVLEIGSGWGSFAIRAVQRTGCQVDSITLSIEQKSHAEKRIGQLGLQDRIRIHLLDYRKLPKRFVGAFDRVVSIEMIEAVGLEYLETYFSVVERSLKPGRGIGVFQVITIPEGWFPCLALFFYEDLRLTFVFYLA